MAAPMHLATTGPRLCGSGQALRSCPRLRIYRDRHACQAHRRTARKLASRFFPSAPLTRTRPEPTQSLNTHQGSPACWYGIAPGCVVGPNSGGGFGQSLLSGAKSFLGTASGYTSYSNADAAFRSGHILGGLGWWMQGNVEFVSSALPIAKGVSSLAGVVDSAVSRLFSTSVVHFTDQAGVDAIQASGALRAGSYVALPGEVAGMSPAQVEEFLEIQPGRGALSTTIQIPKSELLIPPNGPLTSGGATQFQISMPKPPGPFVPTPPGG